MVGNVRAVIPISSLAVSRLLVTSVALAALSPAPRALAQLAPGEQPPDAPARAATAQVDPRVERELAGSDRASVFLMLRGGDAFAGHAQQAVLDALGSEFELAHRYRNIAAVAGELTQAGLSAAREHADVAAILFDSPGSGGLKEALPAAGVDRVQTLRGLKGTGVTVAVLDTGVSTRHPALQNAVVAQKCFTSRACAPSGAREGDSAEDDHNHGSNVAGIVASRGGGGVSVGYAPGANLVAVKVLNANNAGRTSDWVAGFDWVYSNLDRLKVKVINASLCTLEEYANAAECDRQEAALAAITSKLIGAGVTVVASSGNTGHTETLAAPACNSGVIAVGATYDSDLGRQPEEVATYRALGGAPWPACSDATTSATTLACFTSTGGARLDVLAPGSQITSAGRGNGVSMFRGTSQAAPGVAGLAALLLECNPSLTPRAIVEILKATGKPVMDPRNGMSYPMIRGVEAVEMGCPPGPPMPVPAPPVDPGSVAPGGPDVAPVTGGASAMAPSAGTTGTLQPSPPLPVGMSGAAGSALPGDSSRPNIAVTAAGAAAAPSSSAAALPAASDVAGGGCQISFAAPGGGADARLVAMAFALSLCFLRIAGRRRTQR